MSEISNETSDQMDILNKTYKLMVETTNIPQNEVEKYKDIIVDITMIYGFIPGLISAGEDKPDKKKKIISKYYVIFFCFYFL